MRFTVYMYLTKASATFARVPLSNCTYSILYRTPFTTQYPTFCLSVAIAPFGIVPNLLQVAPRRLIPFDEFIMILFPEGIVEVDELGDGVVTLVVGVVVGVVDEIAAFAVRPPSIDPERATTERAEREKDKNFFIIFVGIIN